MFSRSSSMDSPPSTPHSSLLDSPRDEMPYSPNGVVSPEAIRNEFERYFAWDTRIGADDGSISEENGGRAMLSETSKPFLEMIQKEKQAHLAAEPDAQKPNHSAFHFSLIDRIVDGEGGILSNEEVEKLEKLQQLRIKFLRLVQRLGLTTEESPVEKMLYEFKLLGGWRTGQFFNLDAAMESASTLEAEGRGDLDDYWLNIVVIGKTGVGKSATINSLFDEVMTQIGAYRPATTAIIEVVGMIAGLKVRVFDTPGLKSFASERRFNTKVLSNVKKLGKKTPPDVVMYVDRLDSQTVDTDELPFLRSIFDALGLLWRRVLVLLTHAASTPPNGPSGSPLSYDEFVSHRSQVVRKMMVKAVDNRNKDLFYASMTERKPIAFAENHPSCQRNGDGQKVIPSGECWRFHLLILCYSMKILAEARSVVSEFQKSYYSYKRSCFGFPYPYHPLSYSLSWLLPPRSHPKHPADQGGVGNVDADIELADLSDSDVDEDEALYDQLMPFKPLKKAQIDKLSREQRKAYFEEYDYQVRRLQKKQWKEGLRRKIEMKGKVKTDVNDYGHNEKDYSPGNFLDPLPHLTLPASFDSDDQAYRYCFLETTSQFLTFPLLDMEIWDHDCGYNGVKLEHRLAIVSQFPAAVTAEITKDKKDFSLHLDSSVAAKHGENGSSMLGFDIREFGNKLAYILRGESKFQNFKRNRTGAGVSMTFLDEHVSTGLKVEDQISLGKHLVLVGSARVVRCQGHSAYGTNVEVRFREADFPIGQNQFSLGLSLVKLEDLELGANFSSQFSIGRNYKMAVSAAFNNWLMGVITVRTRSSDQLQIALLAILPIARAVFEKFWPRASENYSIY